MKIYCYFAGSQINSSLNQLVLKANITLALTLILILTPALILIVTLTLTLTLTPTSWLGTSWLPPVLLGVVYSAAVSPWRKEIKQDMPITKPPVGCYCLHCMLRCSFPLTLRPLQPPAHAKQGDHTGNRLSASTRDCLHSLMLATCLLTSADTDSRSRSGLRMISYHIILYHIIIDSQKLSITSYYYC